MFLFSRPLSLTVALSGLAKNIQTKNVFCITYVHTISTMIEYFYSRNIKHSTIDPGCPPKPAVAARLMLLFGSGISMSIYLRFFSGFSCSK